MKNAIRSSPPPSRPRRYKAISSAVPVALDITGSSAAETAIPKRLTGSVYSTCA